MVETRQQRAAKEKEKAATDNKEQTKDVTPEVIRTPKRVIVAAILLLVFSYVTMPDPLQPVGKPSVQHVWYYGWITALSTGLGVLPLVIIPDLDKFWVGVSNGT